MRVRDYKTFLKGREKRERERDTGDLGFTPQLCAIYDSRKEKPTLHDLFRVQLCDLHLSAMTVKDTRQGRITETC